MNLEQLKSMDVDQLRELAGKMDVKIHHMAGKEKLVKAIAEKAIEPMTNPETVKAEVAPVKAASTEPSFCEECEVNEAIAEFTAKGLVAIYPKDGTWIFRCRGAEESGSLSMPLRLIVNRARIVSRGAIAPRGFKADPITVAGNSAYTNVVLSG